MTFGRLDIHWPDGAVEVHQLEKPAVGIGRQRGNDIVLDHNTVSRYHASLVVEDDICYVQDLNSANGTYVDGIRLESNALHLLRGSEELRFGDVSAVYRPPVEADAADTVPASVTTTQVLALAQPTFQVTVSSAEHNVTPGVHARDELVIHNVGKQRDSYFIEVDGVPRDWVRLSQVEVELDPDEQGRVVIVFRPPRRPESVPGDYSVNIHVRARSNAAQTVAAPVSLRVLDFSAFEMHAEPSHTPVQPRHPFTVHVHNHGNTPLTISLSGRDPQAALQFHFQPPTLTLQPGQRVSVLATAEPARPLASGDNMAYPFTVVAAAHNAAGWQVGVPVRLGVSPSTARRWMGAGVVAAALLLVLVVAFAAVGLALLRPAPPQFVTELTRDNPLGDALRAGDVLAFSWEAQNAAQLQLKISLNGQPSDQIDLPPDARQYAYPLTDSGLYRFSLVASSDGSSAESAPLDVVVMPRVVSFDVSPRVLVEGVQQTLMFTWETQGATGVKIAGLSRLMGPAGDEPRQPSGDETLSVVYPAAEGSISLTLLALGNGVPDQPSDTLDVRVIPAECHVIHEGATLYDIEGRPPLAALRADDLVIAQARDPDRAWLHVRTQAGLLGWVAQGDLFCEGFDPARLVVSDAIPTPAFTPTPTMPPTPTPTPFIAPPQTPTPPPPPQATP